MQKTEARLQVLTRPCRNEPESDVSPTQPHTGIHIKMVDTNLSPLILCRFLCGLLFGVLSLCCLVISRRSA
jgi:hypothetical protein